MDEVSPDQLKRAVEAEHGCTATLVQSVPVDERIGDKPVWQGVVHVFDLVGHPKAKRAYAWSSPLPGGNRRFFAVLRIGPVTGPVEAVRAAIVAEAKRGEGFFSPKALRKLKRKADNAAYSKDERSWRNVKSALQLGHDKPVNRQASKDLSHEKPKKR
jgi:hypothetical protein